MPEPPRGVKCELLLPISVSTLEGELGWNGKDGEKPVAIHSLEKAKLETRNLKPGKSPGCRILGPVRVSVDG